MKIMIEREDDDPPEAKSVTFEHVQLFAIVGLRNMPLVGIPYSFSHTHGNLIDISGELARAQARCMAMLTQRTRHAPADGN